MIKLDVLRIDITDVFSYHLKEQPRWHAPSLGEAWCELYQTTVGDGASIFTWKPLGPNSDRTSARDSG